MDDGNGIPAEPISHDWDETPPVYTNGPMFGESLFRVADCTQCKRRTILRFVPGGGWLCNICDPETTVFAGTKAKP